MFEYYCDGRVNETERAWDLCRCDTDSIRWNCDCDTADRISCFNRHYAEYSGYFETTSFVDFANAAGKKNEQISHDSVTGKKLLLPQLEDQWMNS